MNEKENDNPKLWRLLHPISQIVLPIKCIAPCVSSSPACLCVFRGKVSVHRDDLASQLAMLFLVSAFPTLGLHTHAHTHKINLKKYNKTKNWAGRRQQTEDIHVTGHNRVFIRDSSSWAGATVVEENNPSGMFFWLGGPVGLWASVQPWEPAPEPLAPARNWLTAPLWNPVPG